MANAFVHVELSTTDLLKAKAFYGQLFAWQLDDLPAPEGCYTLIRVGAGTGGGMMTQMTPGAPSTWLPYVQVDDIAVATRRARELGATVLRDVTQVMEAGWLALITDPTGAHLGLWQERK